MLVLSRRPRARRLLITAAAATIAVAIAGCAPVADSADDADRTLKISIAGSPPSFDPAQLDNGDSSYIWSSVFDTLLAFDLRGELQPNLAESWEYSEDALTLTLTLRTDATFSTGDPVVAADVRDTLVRDQTTPGLRQSELATVASIEAPDDATVVVTLSEPTPSLLSNLAMGLGAVGDPDTLDEERTALDPVGSGPYILDQDASVVGSSYVLERRDDHWNADAYPFSTINVRVIEDRQAAFNALQANELDFGLVQIDQIEAIEAAGFTTTVVEAGSIASLLILDREGELVPALGDVRVRQAINMAFDRQLYVDQLLYGAGSPTVQLFNPALGAYDPDLVDYYGYDVDGAKALLADAGYPDGFAMTLPSTYFSTAFEPALTQSLSDIGVTVTWEPVPPQEVASSLASKKYPMAWFFDGLNVPARELDNNFGPTGFLNPFAYQNEELNALVDTLAVTVDPDEANVLYKQINDFIVENALSAPIMYLSTTWATSEGVTFLQEGAGLATLRNFGTAE